MPWLKRAKRDLNLDPGLLRSPSVFAGALAAVGASPPGRTPQRPVPRRLWPASIRSFRPLVDLGPSPFSVFLVMYL